MNFRRQKLEEVGVNLTPLIDVVFLLLIFFMVSTTFTKENRLTLRLPEASAREQEAVKPGVEIVINAAGQYLVNSLAVTSPTLENLKTVLTEVAGEDRSQPLVITADANAPHQAVVRAMDAAGQLGFASLSLSTQPLAEQ